MTDLPRGWASAVGGDLFATVRGVTYEKQDAASEPSDGLVPILRANNISNGAIVADDLVYVPTRYVSSEQHLADGDILIAASSGSRSVVGKAAPADGSHGKLAFGAFCTVVRPRKTALAGWLRSYLRTRQYRDYVERVAVGMNINNLRGSDLNAIPIPLAPLVEQGRIVAKVDRLSAKSKRARDHLDHLPRLVEKYKQAILSAAFSGSLTREWRLNQPDARWGIRGVREIVTKIVAGKNLRCEERPPAEGERGVVKVSAVSWGTFDRSASKTLPKSFIPPEETRIRAGDFLISRANTIELVGAVVIVDEAPSNLFLSDKILRLELSVTDKKWLLWFLRSPEGRVAIENGATGNQLSMRNLSQAALLAIEVPWPDSDERDEIVRRIEAAFGWIDRLAKEATNARVLVDRLDQAILAKAFRGELVPQDPNDEPASVLLAQVRQREHPGRIQGRRRKSGSD